MMKLIFTFILTIYIVSGKAQSFTDKIIVIKNTYENQSFPDNEKIYSSDKIEITNRKSISEITSELTKFDNEEQLLLKFGIDTNYVLNEPEKLLKLYEGYYKKNIDSGKQFPGSYIS